MKAFCNKFYSFLWFPVAGPCQIWGTILVINGFWNWSYKKIISTKNVFLNSYSTLKKSRKIQMIFVIENSLSKPNFGTFWYSPALLISKKISNALFFGYQYLVRHEFCIHILKWYTTTELMLPWIQERSFLLPSTSIFPYYLGPLLICTLV